MLFTFSAVGCSRGHRVFWVTVIAATFLCYAFLSLMDRWASAHRPSVGKTHPRIASNAIYESSALEASSDAQRNEAERQHWEKVYEERLQRVRGVCEHDEMAMMRRIWRVAANRRFGKKTYCKTRMCPIIVDERRVLFYCFIPKVASTRVKEFLLRVSGVRLNDTVLHNDTTLHEVANTFLRRVSPMYYPATTARRFYKIMFVRHPFDRLVSSFKSKAEGPREELRYFYDVHWDRVMRKLRPNNTVDENSVITFPEFVWYVTHTLDRDYDEHWTPFWSRCDPCLVDYDFIGKLETADHDFKYAFEKIGLESPTSFWSNSRPHGRSETQKYFSQVSEKSIRDLYKIYKLDFDLFGYTLDGFLKNP